MNYIMLGISHLRFGVIAGGFLYFAILLLLFAGKTRKRISWRNLAELVFCIYGVTLLKAAGIFSLRFFLHGTLSYNLIPFLGSSFLPVALNMVLFVPLGFLLPCVFPKGSWNWKKAAAAGLSVSCAIEVLQLFGGRYAEMEDLLINAFGTWVGFMLYHCLRAFRSDRKKAWKDIALLCVTLGVCLGGIWLVGDHEEPLPDGLLAAEKDVLEVNLYCGGKKRNIDISSEIYMTYATMLNNCGGHLLEAQAVSEKELWTGDCCIELLYAAPQAIRFENAEDFTINADRILYNADRYMLYWGNGGYQNSLNYAALDTELAEHQDTILEEYDGLRSMIADFYGN